MIIIINMSFHERYEKKSFINKHGDIIRPRNAFMIWLQCTRMSVISDEPQSMICKNLGEVWKNEVPQYVKNIYRFYADKEKAHHKRLFPDYMFHPHRNKATNKKKTKIKNITKKKSSPKEKKTAAHLITPPFDSVQQPQQEEYFHHEENSASSGESSVSPHLRIDMSDKYNYYFLVMEEQNEASILAPNPIVSENFEFDNTMMRTIYWNDDSPAVKPKEETDTIAKEEMITYSDDQTGSDLNSFIASEIMQIEDIDYFDQYLQIFV